jgi:hypothetical protein
MHKKDPVLGDRHPIGTPGSLASMIMGAEIGMLIVETIAKIRRAFFVQGKPIVFIRIPIIWGRESA